MDSRGGGLSVLSFVFLFWIDIITFFCAMLRNDHHRRNIYDVTKCGC